MPQTTRKITFSLPREMANWVEEIAEQEGISRSALLREALARYMDENEWQKTPPLRRTADTRAAE